jgi:hypothetical protein
MSYSFISNGNTDDKFVNSQEWLMSHADKLLPNYRKKE